MPRSARTNLVVLAQHDDPSDDHDSLIPSLTAHGPRAQQRRTTSLRRGARSGGSSGPHEARIRDLSVTHPQLRLRRWLWCRPAWRSANAGPPWPSEPTDLTQFNSTSPFAVSPHVPPPHLVKTPPPVTLHHGEYPAGRGVSSHWSRRRFMKTSAVAARHTPFLLSSLLETSLPSDHVERRLSSCSADLAPSTTTSMSAGGCAP